MKQRGLVDLRSPPWDYPSLAPLLQISCGSELHLEQKQGNLMVLSHKNPSGGVASWIPPAPRSLFLYLVQQGQGMDVGMERGVFWPGW